jgi:hypothetical protein
MTSSERSSLNPLGWPGAVYGAITRPVSNLAKKGAQAAGSKALSMLSNAGNTASGAAVEALKTAVFQEPTEEVRRAKNDIVWISKTLDLAEHNSERSAHYLNELQNPQKRKRFVRSLTNFLRAENASLSAQEKAALEQLIQRCKNNQGLDLSLIPLCTNVKRAILRIHEQQTGIVANLKNQAAGLMPNNAASAAAAKETERLLRGGIEPNGASYQILNELPQTPADIAYDLSLELQKLKNNSIMMVIGQIVLYNLCGICPESDEVTDLIRKSRGSVEDFKRQVDAKIDQQTSFVSNWLIKLVCNCLFYVIASYMNNFFAKLENDLSRFVFSSSEEQLQVLQNLMLNPMADHLSSTLSHYRQLANPQTTIAQVPKKALAELIEKQRIGGRTPSDILHDFVATFLGRYTDNISRTQNFLQNINGYLERQKKASDSTLEKCASISGQFAIKAVDNLLRRPLGWLVNRTVRFILEQIVKKIAFPAMTSSTQAGMGLGTLHPLYYTKRNLVNVLKSVLRTVKQNQFSANPAPYTEIPEGMQQQFKVLIANLVDVLRAQMASDTIPGLQGHVEKQQAIEQITSFLDQLLMDPVQSALRASVIQMLMQEGFLNNTLLTSVRSLNESFFSTEQPTAAQMNHVEQELTSTVKEMRDILFAQALDPVQQDQAKADLFVDRLNSAIQTTVDKFEQTEDARQRTALALALSESAQRIYVEATKSDPHPTTLNQINAYYGLFMQVFGVYCKKVQRLETEKDVAMQQAPIYARLVGQLQGLKRINYPRKETLAFLTQLRRTNYSLQMIDDAERNGIEGLDRLFIALTIDFEKTINESVDSQALNNARQLLPERMLLVTAWARQNLRHFRSQAQPTTAQKFQNRAITVLGADAPIKERLSSYLTELFAFLSEPAHFNGMLRYTMSAAIPMLESAH